MQRSIKTSPLPTDNAVDYELVLMNGMNVNIRVPWVAYVSDLVMNPNGECYVPQNGVGIEEHTDKTSPVPGLRQRLKKHLRVHHYLSASLQAGQREIDIYSVGNDAIALKVATFAPENNEYFLETVRAAFETGAAKNVSKLIIDLRGNGGGDICLGYQFVELVSRASNVSGIYDVFASNLTTTLFSIVFFTKSLFILG